MSDHNPEPMNKEELEKYIEKDFLPSLLSKFPNIPDLVAENARLKAEVERLRKLFADTERLMLLDGEYEAAKVGTYALLKAEVERLRKAGDAMAENLLEGCNHKHYMNALNWNAAKEGKPSV